MAPGSHSPHSTKKALTDGMFGVMAPCSRLLERAKAYMDKVNIALSACVSEEKRLPRQIEHIWSKQSFQKLGNDWGPKQLTSFAFLYFYSR